MVRALGLIERAYERMGGQGGSMPGRWLPVRPSASRENGPAEPEAALDEPTVAASNPAASTSAAPDEAAMPVSVALLEKAGLAVGGGKRSRLTEEWRVTAGELLRNLRAPATASEAGAVAVSTNLVLVTSASPGEGKTFAALNLAASLAAARLAEVLLIDVDQKAGGLTDTIGLSDRRGLFDLAVDPALRAEDLVVRTEIAGLAIMPIGTIPAAARESAERAVDHLIAETLERVAARFANQVVILDSAPCLMSSDAFMLASVVTQVAMIVQAERTQRAQLEGALDMLRSCPNILLVLNKARRRKKNAFGSDQYPG